MTYEIHEEERKRAKTPHELFLINLIFNHVLVFVTLLGAASSYPEPLLFVPLFSVAMLSYILLRARKALREDSWFVKVHWQIAARRSRFFIAMLGFLGAVGLLGWVGATYLGMMEVAVYAMIGGIGMFPTMIAVLVLIILESESMHQARHGQASRWAEERFPNKEVPVIAD